MTTYTINNRPKLLAPDDKAIFVTSGATRVYFVETPGTFLRCKTPSMVDGNRSIFRDLALDAEVFAERAYGYEPCGGAWPEASPHGDFPALTRLVNALFDHIASLEPERPCKDCPIKQEPKQPALLEVGTWVRSLRGASHDGQIGKILGRACLTHCFYEVQFSDGEIRHQLAENVVPVANWERFKIGDYVKGEDEDGDPAYGFITEHDPRGPSGEHWAIGECWVKDSSLEFAEPRKAYHCPALDDAMKSLTSPSGALRGIFAAPKAFEPGDPVRVIKGIRTPAGASGIVISKSDNDGYLVRWDLESGPVVRWAHENQIEHI